MLSAVTPAEAYRTTPDGSGETSARRVRENRPRLRSGLSNSRWTYGSRSVCRNHGRIRGRRSRSSSFAPLPEFAVTQSRHRRNRFRSVPVDSLDPDPVVASPEQRSDGSCDHAPGEAGGEQHGDRDPGPDTTVRRESSDRHAHPPSPHMAHPGRHHPDAGRGRTARGQCRRDVMHRHGVPLSWRVRWPPVRVRSTCDFGGETEVCDEKRTTRSSMSGTRRGERPTEVRVFSILLPVIGPGRRVVVPLLSVEVLDRPH